jgi:hypothetical protein
MAVRWMWIALVPGVIAMLFALTLLAGMDNPRHHEAHGARLIGMILANVVCVGLPGLLALRYLVRARRYGTFAKRAAEDATLTWHLSGKIVAAARGGVPVPELAFPVAGYLRRELTAVPAARLVQ